MRRSVTPPLVVLAVLALAPGWSGEAQLALLRQPPIVHAERVTLDLRDPARRRVGRLFFLGGVALSSPDPAFGGFSALAVEGDRVTLLGDGGHIVRFSLAPDWTLSDLRVGHLAAGPKSGWEKRHRDSESLVTAPDGRSWVGFEAANAIFRFAPDGRPERWARPPAMQGWSINAGAEAMVRLPDGRFVAISEADRPRNGRGRKALLFARDPTVDPRAQSFTYMPPGGYSPSDAAVLPDGDLIVVNRRFVLPFRFVTVLTRVAAGRLRPGAIATGEPIATLDRPLLHDNFEGVAVTREGGSTIVWLVSDDNQSRLQRSLLLKFRLDTQQARRP